MKSNCRLLIIGSGGREHALAWKCHQSPHIQQIFIAPGNAGTAQIGTNVDINANNLPGLLDFAKQNNIDLTIVGPEEPLTMGIVDLFQQHHLPIFGPSKSAARLEGSKVFAKHFLEKHLIPTASYRVFYKPHSAYKYLETCSYPRVIKADGLAAGKGVLTVQTLKKAQEAIDIIMTEKKFGSAGSKVIIEEYLEGEEVSIVCLTDGSHIVPLLPAVDHKAIFEQDQGPNTGGMGAYVPAPVVTPALLQEIKVSILEPTIRHLKQSGSPYLGVLYAGLMLTSSGPKVLEFNCRFGDPETQPQLTLLKSDLIDLIDACLSHTLHQQSVSWYPGFAVSVVLASKGYPGKYDTGFPITGLDQVSPPTTVFQAGTHLNHNHPVTSGGRVLAVTSRADSLKTAIHQVYQGVDHIHFQNMYFRRDIAAKALDPTKSFSIKSNTSPHKLFVTSSIQDPRIASITKLIPNQVQATIHIIDNYTIEAELSSQDLDQVSHLLTNPLTQIVHINQLPYKDAHWYLEIGYLPGVTDNIGQTATESLKDLLKLNSPDIHIYSSQTITIEGNLSDDEVKYLAQELHNPLIQYAKITSQQQAKVSRQSYYIPQVKLTPTSVVDQVNLDISDEELKILGQQGIPNSDGTRRGPLALDLTYLQAIRTYFNQQHRQPTDIELESIAQTWSEHCKHTIFADPIDDLQNGLFNTYIKRATQEVRSQKGASDFCVSVFEDNSGAIAFDSEYLLTDKVETHNSPSALDPFGGAITGIVGVNRDTIGFGLGAKPIVNRYGYCFAAPNSPKKLYKGPKKTQPMLSPRRIMEGVIKGVNVGGNCSGIPTTQGFLVFDPGYQGKPLVFVGTVGLIPRMHAERKLNEKKAIPGDHIVMVGGRVGQDGIHGATFSSEAINPHSPAGAVQIGDPITQKKLSDALVKEARDLNLYHSITDNGAGGLSCSVAEMAKECGGCEIQLDKVPLKYPGLAPWQIWISESQERMTVSVPPPKWADFTRLMERRGVEATIIGTFTNTGKCIVTQNGHTIMDVDMDFLHDGLPPRQLQTKPIKHIHKTPSIPPNQDFNHTLISLLKSLNQGSFSAISTQYDHEVQGTSVLKPLQGKGRVNGDATIVRPVPSSLKGAVMSQGIFPHYSHIDTYHMAAHAIDTAIRHAVVAGADPDQLALLDNFCWCSSNDPIRLGQLKKAAQACYDYAVMFGTPFISGKDSMFNDFNGYDEKSRPQKISIPPTLLISSLGIINDVSQAISIDPKFPGDLVYLLGTTSNELGASTYYYHWSDPNQVEAQVGSKLPPVNARRNKKLYQRYAQCVKDGLIASAKSVTSGGITLALAKMALAGDLGLKINLTDISGSNLSSEATLFAESAGRIIVTINPEYKSQFEAQFKGVACALIGTVSPQKRLQIQYQHQMLIDLALSASKDAYQHLNRVIDHLPPKALILTGYGINCEEETAHAFTLAGAHSDIVHVNDLIDGLVCLDDYQILCFPGGFSFGDDTGSGNAFAARVKNHLWPELVDFIEKDSLIIGICNGFQIIANLGLLPSTNSHLGQRSIALAPNDTARYTDRWVDLEINHTPSPWLKNITKLSLPIAHGEGKFYASEETLSQLHRHHQVALKYTFGDICAYQQVSPNPNGSLEDIAGITDESGRVLGLMPHPERAIFFHHLPHWPYLKEVLKREGKNIPAYGPGFQIFQNAVKYFT